MFKDLTGKKFGMLTVVKRIGNKSYLQNKNNPAGKKTVHALWECKCDCGNTKNVTTNKLKPHLTVSCGCNKIKNLKHQRGKSNPSWTGYNDISYAQWNSIVNSAIKRKIEFTITIQYAWDIWIKQNSKCALSNVDLIMYDDTKRTCDKYRTASLDRIDSSKGYIEGNVQWIHKTINYMKWKLLEEEFILFCNLISKQHPR